MPNVLLDGDRVTNRIKLLNFPTNEESSYYKHMLYDMHGTLTGFEVTRHTLKTLTRPSFQDTEGEWNS